MSGGGSMSGGGCTVARVGPFPSTEYDLLKKIESWVDVHSPDYLETCDQHTQQGPSVSWFGNFDHPESSVTKQCNVHRTLYPGYIHDSCNQSVDAYFTDSNNLEAAQLLKKHENESLVLPESILFETLTVLIYKDGVANAKATYEKLTSNKQVLVHYFSVDE